MQAQRLTPADFVDLSRLLASALSDSDLERLVHLSTGAHLHNEYVGRGKTLILTIEELLRALERHGTTDTFLAVVYRDLPRQKALREMIRRLYPQIADQATQALLPQEASVSLPPEPGDAARLAEDENNLLAALRDTPALMTAARRVLESPDYPRKMFTRDKLIPNPAWDYADENTTARRPIANCLRAHMFLIIAEPPRQIPLIYCYWSQRWEAFLLPFFKHAHELGDAKQAQRALQRHSRDHYGAACRPTERYMVSVKQNREHPKEWWLYAFQFHGVVPAKSFAPSKRHEWLSLERLTDTHYPEARVNADVVRAIRDCFGTGLHDLPRSGITPRRGSRGHT